MSSLTKFGYTEFLWLISKPIVISTCENACAFLNNENQRCTPMPLSLRILRYQRAVCVNGLNKYKVVPSQQKEMLNTVRNINTIGNKNSFKQY